MSISFKKSVKESDGLLCQELTDGEIVFLNLNNESYFGLDKIGTDIWKELLKSKNIETAYNNLLQKYEVEPENLRKDIEDLISKLLDNGLLEFN
ncbi:MAG: PqqD family protein [Thermodesulfobacteriota bacterium]